MPTKSTAAGKKPARRASKEGVVTVGRMTLPPPPFDLPAAAKKITGWEPRVTMYCTTEELVQYSDMKYFTPQRSQDYLVGPYIIREVGAWRVVNKDVRDAPEVSRRIVEVIEASEADIERITAQEAAAAKMTDMQKLAALEAETQRVRQKIARSN